MATRPWRHAGLALALVVSAPTNHAAAQTSRVVDRIELRELTSSGDTIPLAPSPLVPIDINSTILITPSFGGIGSAAGVVTGQADDRALRAERQAMLDLLRQLEESIELGVRAASDIGALLETLDAAGDTARYAARVRDFGRITLARQAAVDAYLTAKGLSGTDLENEQDRLTPMGGDYGPLRDFIRDEVAAANRVNGNRIDALTSEDRRVSLVLGASVVRGSRETPVHLPGYDTREAGIPTVVPKVSFDLSETEAARLADEVQFNTALADQLRSIDAVKGDLGRLASAAVGKLREGLESGRSQASALVETLEGVVTAAGADVGALTGAAVGDASTRLQTVLTRVGEVEAAVEAIVGAIDAIPSTANPQARPDLFLVSITRDIAQGEAALRAAIAALPTALAGVSAALSDYEQALAAVADRTAASALETIEESVTRAVGEATAFQTGIMAELGRVLDLASRVSGAPQPFQPAGLAAGITRDLVDDPQVRRRDLGSAPPTQLSLLSTERAEGDRVVFQANVSAGRTPLEERSVTFAVKKFGWYSEVKSGLVFVNTEDAAYASLGGYMPTAQAAFLFRHRSRGRGMRWIEHVGIGFHSVALYFDDATPIELGLGLSIHVLDNVAHAGWGKNLHAPGEPNYWFVGLGVLDLLNRARGDGG